MDTGFLLPRTVSQTGTGTSWTNISNALNNGFGSAECQQSASGSSKEIWLTNFDLSGIPSGSVIDGIYAQIIGGETEDYAIVYTSLIRAVHSSAQVGTGKSSGAAWYDSDPDFGGPSDKWGIAGLNLAYLDSSFGFAIVATKYPHGDGGIVISQLDYLRVKFYYSQPSGPSAREIIQYS